MTKANKANFTSKNEKKTEEQRTEPDVEIQEKPEVRPEVKSEVDKKSEPVPGEEPFYLPPDAN